MNKKFIASLLAFSTVPLTGFTDVVFNEKLYGYIYWENGLPITDLARRPDSWANPDMAADPNLIIQTGYYNLRFDADDVDLSGFDAAEGSDYMSALTEDVTEFSDGSILLKAYKDGVAYTARTGVVENDDSDLEVHLIENGQFLQRFDHTGLVFTDSDGNELGSSGYFEVTAWPDRVVFTLDFSDDADVERTTIQVKSPEGTAHLKDSYLNKINLAIKPQDDEKLSTLTASRYITEAYEADTSDELDVTFDSDLYAFYIELDPDKISYSTDDTAVDRYDEYVIEVTNPTDTEANIPLVFAQATIPTITGTVMLLADYDDGRPTGLPVQISKNWHKSDDYVHKHEGSWLRGSSMVTLEANSSKKFKLRVIYGYWDQVGAVSHAQLSLIGYGNTHWKWDESAVGAWGESMTYDPNQAIAAAFIADVRPTWTTPTSSSYTDHGWTGNYGGGDFLKYFDENGDYRWGKKIKTAYRWTGPNMTEVLYSGYSDDDKLRFTYTTQQVRSNDYHRRFHSYKYEILEDIEPTRFVYHQMAADYYTGPDFDYFYRGNGSYLYNSVQADHGGNDYTGDSYYFHKRWLAIDDTETSSGDDSANRGIISLASTLNDTTKVPYLHTYGRTWGSDKTLFDLSGESTSESYKAGDVIEGKLEFIMPAESSSEYWGDDDDFADRLAAYENSWDAIQDEHIYNNMSISVSKGTLQQSYPVVINAADATVLAKFTIPADSGVGHIPVVIQNASAGLALRAQYKMEDSDSWQWAAENSSNINTNALYQGYYNGDGTMDYVFNIIRPSGTLSKAMTVRVFSTGDNN
ncbi:hypothetical protein [Reinekea marinisedimentorum]|uniref:Uncharacterized protein n=1 Tax=Reinekea marinisedimentorum TaxID=230495 RepID=A0A4R3I1A9_9GAMM|nr:hypothetical protein [Reinekea marinisedimentorum]TCS38984.1 hypothetical protein BCF53_11330 [Reinekea marinisedimentorum]